MSIIILNPFLSEIVVKVKNFFTNGYNSGRLTTTSTADQSVQTLSTTEVSADYVTFWQATGDNSSGTSDFRAQLFETSVRQLEAIEPQDTTDAFSVGGAFPYTGGTDKTFQIQYSTESGTAGIAGRALNILQLESSDYHAHTAGTTSATANAVSVTITQAGTYIIIGSGVVGAGDSCGIYDGSTLYGEIGTSMNQDATTLSPYFHIEQFTVSTTTTFSVRVTTGTIQQASIIALRTDSFENSYYFTDGTNTQTTSSDSFVTAAGFTPTLVNPGNYHLILGSAFLEGSNNRNTVSARLANATRNSSYNVPHQREPNNSGESYPTVVTRLSSFVDTSPTINWEISSEANNTASLRASRIAILDLGQAAPPIYFIASTTALNSTSIDISDQAEEGDIVIIASHSTNSTVNTPTGYTDIANGVSNTVRYQASYKIMGATPDSTASGLTSGNNLKHVAMVFRYIDPSTPLDVTIVNTTASSGQVNPGSITSSNRSVILAIGYLDDDEVLSSTVAPSGFTLCGVEENSGTIMCAYKVQDSAGAEDPGTFTGGDDAWVALTIALRIT